jgi:murein DD-endopeptidase MepM/ murein hydrolase activator NlpD
LASGHETDRIFLMRYWLGLLLLLPTLTLAQNEAGEDLNNLIEQFFGNGQEPVLVEPDLPLSDNIGLDSSETEIRQSIQLEETILESYRSEVEEREARLWDLQGQKNSLNQQIELLDQQISLDREQIEMYTAQQEKWEAVLTEITEQRALLDSALRAERTDYQTLMAQQYIRAQNLGSDDRVSWWEWLFSPRSVSQILTLRQERKRVLDQKQNSLKTLEELKRDLEARERQAAVVYGRSTELSQQLLNDKAQLRPLIAARAQLLDQVSRDRDAEEQALAQAQAQRRESTQYLVQLRDQLREFPEEFPEEVLTEDEIAVETEVSVFAWPLAGDIRVTATFRDEAYEENFGRPHDGVDLYAPQGSPVIAPANGVVEKVATNGYGYSYLILAHKNGLYTVYGHLSDILVEEEEIVYIGKEIAKTGGTPGTPGAGYFTTGPHLHFEVFRDGQFFDPLEFLPSLD